MPKSAQSQSHTHNLARKRLPGIGIAAILTSVLVLSACSSQAGNGAEQPTGTPESTATGTLGDVLPAKYKEAGAITFGTTGNNPPWSLHDDATNVFSGFEPALVTEMIKRLGVDADIQRIPYEGLQTGLLAGKYDVMFSSMHDTAEREKQMVFVDYAVVGSAFLAAKGNPEGIVDLASACGKTLIVNPSSVQVSIIDSFQPECASKGLEPINVVSLPDASASLLGVTSGQGDAYFGDKVALTYLAENAGGGAVEVASSAKAGVDAGFVGMAALTANKDLMEALQASLQSMIDDGTYAEILDEYGFADVGVDEAHINGTTTAPPAS